MTLQAPTPPSTDLYPARGLDTRVVSVSVLSGARPLAVSALTAAINLTLPLAAPSLLARGFVDFTGSGRQPVPLRVSLTCPAAPLPLGPYRGALLFNGSHFNVALHCIHLGLSAKQLQGAPAALLVLDTCVCAQRVEAMAAVLSHTHHAFFIKFVAARRAIAQHVRHPA